MQITKKKILVFFPSFLQASEGFIADQLELLSADYELHIYSFNKDCKEVKISLPGIKIIYEQQFSQLYDKASYPFIHKYSESQQKLQLYFLKSLSKYLETENIDSVLCQFLTDATYLHKIRGFSPSVQITTLARGKDIYCDFPKFSLAQRNSTIKNIHRLFVRDSCMHEKANHLGFHSKQIEISRTGKKIIDFNFQKKNFSEISILFGGRLVEKKGILESLCFLEVLLERKKIPIKRIYMLGDTLSNSSYVQKIREKILHSPLLSKNVVLCGFLERPAYLDILHNKVNICIGHFKQAPNGDMDGIPNILLENMLVGNLCFSTLSGGIKDILQHQKNAYILSDDVLEDATLFEEVFSNDLEVILNYARKSVIDMFDQKTEIAQLKKVL